MMDNRLLDTDSEIGFSDYYSRSWPPSFRQGSGVTKSKKPACFWLGNGSRMVIIHLNWVRFRWLSGSKHTAPFGHTGTHCGLARSVPYSMTYLS